MCGKGTCSWNWPGAVVSNCGPVCCCRSLYNAALICRLVLTWFPNPPAQLVGPLSTVTDP